MDYLVYTYLQTGQDQEASRLVGQLGEMHNLDEADFKVAYAFTAMPVRLDVERGRWSDAATIVPPEKAPLQVVAVALWARGLGLLRRMEHPDSARVEIEKLERIEEQLHTGLARIIGPLGSRHPNHQKYRPGPHRPVTSEMKR